MPLDPNCYLGPPEPCSIAAFVVAGLSLVWCQTPLLGVLHRPLRYPSYDLGACRAATFEAAT